MGMSSHDLVSPTLAAYALDACDDDEALVVEDHVAGCATCSDELHRLRHAAGWLGSEWSERPPSALRSRIIGAGPRSAALAPPVAAYVAETQRFERLLEHLPADGWETATAAEGWNARQLVAHLLATDSLFAANLGAPAVVPESQTDLVERTKAVQARHRTLSLATTIAEWRQVRNVLVQVGARTDPDTPVEWVGVEIPTSGMFVIRAFETWTHADDIRIALGQAIDPPGEDALALMTNLLCDALPVALLVREIDVAPSTARIVLTGPGGGRWDVPLGGAPLGAPIDTVLTTDAISWCRLGADRLQPDEVVTLVEGDTALADALLRAAPAFAVP